ncbi:RFC5 [Hepatospora eriocheir]|uniref:RFC5 n=1 Tax=Hepatospora eriocheir TaxID=1081669 RepID=A0A1X0Q8F9_9MICR|nr:RFC5 [Hepatospora eriocheir]
MLYSFINKLYGSYPVLKQRSEEIKINSTTLNISYLDSPEIVVFDPSEYGYRDRVIIQSLIKNIASTKTLNGFLTGKKEYNIRIILIDKAESLSTDAQAALRRTMEIHSETIRVFMISTEISRLIDPIRSRCILVRMRSFTKEELVQIGMDILNKEGLKFDVSLIEDLANNSHGDSKKFINTLEMVYNYHKENGKKNKVDVNQYKLDWEVKIDNIVKLTKSISTDNFLKIRSELYDLYTSCIEPTTLFTELFNELKPKEFKKIVKFSELALEYETRLLQGTKPIFHLEAFIANVMLLYSS